MSAKVKSPVEKGVAKVPVIMQLETLECGAASLCMVLAYYNKWLPLEQVRSDCGVSRDGSNAKNILKAARLYGLEAKGYRFEPQELKEHGYFPCIIHWNFNHFVVLDGFKNNRAYINDPGRGNYSVTMDAFDEAFTGICILLRPNEAFVQSGRPKSMLEFAKKRMSGSKTALMFVVITTVISSLIGVINPVFSRVFMDRLLTHKNDEWVVPFIIALAVMSVIQIVVSLIQTVYSLRINGKMDAVGSTSYMWKVFRMPIEFFSQRMSGDIQARMYSNASISGTLINIFAPLVLNAFMMVFYLVVMLRYNVFLTIVGLIGVAMNAIISAGISRKRVNLTRVSMRDEAKYQSFTVNAYEMIETIKSSGAEEGFFGKWSGYQASVNSLGVKYTKFNEYLGLIPSIVSMLSSMIILGSGVYLTMQGRFTVGMITAFQGFLASFTAPAGQFISAGQTLQEMRTAMERVDDVMEYPDDTILSDEPMEEGASYKKLLGNVELKNITFGYSKLAKPLIEDFSFSLKTGQRVALVGGTGSGKSTIAKLISGLYRPWSGEILFDGVPLEKINRNVFTSSVGVVDQDIILFEDTIANNIKMWDESIEDFEVILAARDARLHDDIMQRPGGYNCKLIEGGKDLSGGQRQRLEIARVLAPDPTIVILDEATSALDAKTEYEVVKGIRDRGITCIIVAHRLSTIRDCDEIIVLDRGRIVDRGTHSELMEKCERYRELACNE